MIQGYTDLEAVFTASDDESNISHYEYSLGTLNDPDLIISGNKIEGDLVTLKSVQLDPGEIYFYTVKAINKAGLVSMESRSDGFMAVKGYPKISNINDFGKYTSFNDQIVISWDCNDTGYAPIKYYQVDISTDGQSWKHVKNISEKQIVIVPEDIGLNSFEDGVSYFVSVRGVNRAGIITPASEAAITDGIKVDNTPPAEENLQIIHSDNYTTNTFKIHLQANDPHSGITAYKYAVGISRGGTELTDGWITVETNAQIYEKYLELDLEHNNKYYVSFQARNGTGLWSKLISDQGVLAELTPPEIKSFVSSDYVNSTEKINFVSQVEDPETGVTGYRYQITSDKQNIDWSESPVYATTENKINHEFKVEKEYIVEGAEYYLAFQARNRLGLWSSPVFSKLIVDTISPSISLSEPGEKVSNDGTADIYWNIDEAAEVEYNLYKLVTETHTEKIDGGVISVIDPTVQQRYKFNQTDSEPASFYLELIATDQAGNTAEPIIQQIRINAKPLINLGADRSIYKGREIELSAVVDDPDGQIVKYEWDFGDGTGSNKSSPLHSYTETGEYTVTLSCTDNDGGVGTDSIIVKVTNTLEGELALSEIWSGEMNLLGTVIVPSGKKLTIKEGTRIEVPGGKALIVYGSLVVNGIDGQEVQFTTTNYSTGLKWQGINIKEGSGNIVIENAVLEYAERGISLIERDAVMDGLLLQNNGVGIHFFDSSPTIKNCQIINNELYGIKEDGDCSPILSNNYFNNNKAGDYYDSKLTILSPEELKELNVLK